MLTHLVLPMKCAPDDLAALVDGVKASDACVPGYVWDDHDAYDPKALLYARHIDGVQTIMLPDRNVASRWVQAVRGDWPLTVQHGTAALLMAFAQCTDIGIEPSIAFHELATGGGMEVALEELGWFRAADNHPTSEWVDLALGRIERLSPSTPPVATSPRALNTPLDRWRRNYILALKIALLELTPMPAKARVRAFFEWMYREFILGGPAAMLALIYLAPRNPPRQGLFKALRSADRTRAIGGIQNATWDLTHISEFQRLIRQPDAGRSHYLFASFDEGLRQVVRLTVGSDRATGGEDELVGRLCAWWPEADARELVDLLFGFYAQQRPPEWTKAQAADVGGIARFTAAGEAAIRAWAPA